MILKDFVLLWIYQDGGSDNDFFAGSGVICKNKSQVHYKDRKSQSNLVQFCPLIPNNLQHISTQI